MKGSNVGQGIRAASCDSYLSNFSNAVHSCKEAPTSSTSAAKATAVASVTSIVCNANQKALLKVRLLCYHDFFLNKFIDAMKDYNHSY